MSGFVVSFLKLARSNRTAGTESFHGTMSNEGASSTNLGQVWISPSGGECGCQEVEPSTPILQIIWCFRVQKRNYRLGFPAGI